MTTGLIAALEVIGEEVLASEGAGATAVVGEQAMAGSAKL